MNLPALFLVLCALGASRLLELRISRRNRHVDGVRKAEKDPVFKVMVFLHSALFVVIPCEAYVFQRPWHLVQASCAFILLFVASAGRAWVLYTLQHNWNVEVVKPISVITTGPYAYVRHPNYAIVILEIFAISLFHSTWLSMVGLSLLNAWVLSQRIPFEEHVLLQKEEYQTSMKSKKRFLPYVF